MNIIFFIAEALNWLDFIGLMKLMLNFATLSIVL